MLRKSEMIPSIAVNVSTVPEKRAMSCVARTTPVYVKGRQLQSATFFLDGRKVKTVTGPDKSGRYGIKVNTRKLSFGVHRVKILVAFIPASQTKSKILRVLIFRCRPPKPKFTG